MVFLWVDQMPVAGKNDVQKAVAVDAPKVAINPAKVGY